jgi:DHA2 family methylenomycin A resistance protein-like MFS transporter
MRGVDTGWRSLDRRRRGVLACTLSANALVFFDQTAVTVALPSIGRAFGTRADALQWTVTAYLLALAVVMLAAGRLADRVGPRRVFLGGLALFGVGSALCAVAPTFGVLLAARVVQGVGGAVVQPLALTLTTRAVGDARRAWAVGVLAAGGTSLLAMGPLLAGALVLAGWRWLFLVNLPVVAAALVLGARLLTPSPPTASRPIAWHGVGLLLVGLTALVVGFVGIVALGAGALALSAAGVLVLALFARHQRACRNPLVDVGLLRDRLVAGALAALFAIQFAVLGVTVSLTLYLQHGLRLDALQAGLVIAVAGLGTPLLSPLAGRLADRHGPRALVVPGLLLSTLSLLALALCAPLGGVAFLVPGLLGFTLARPMVFTPAGAAPLAALGAEHRGFAAALATEARQLGAVLGVALTTSALVTAHGPVLGEGDPGLSGGFAVAVLVTAAACGAATVLAWRLLPARVAPG